jgi:hypothetical protein
MKPGIPTVMIMGCIVMSVVWILLLRTFAKTIVFTSEAVKVCAMLYLGVKAGAFWFIVAGIYCVYVFCARKKLLFAAKIISHAATGLKENPQMFIALFIVKAVYVVQALLYIKFFEASVKVKTVGLSIELTESYDTNADMVCTTGADYSCAWEDWISEDDDVANNHCYAHDGYCDYPAISLGMVGVCDIVEPSWVSNGRAYIMLVWLWSVMFFTQFRLAIVACVIGSWHWHPDNKPSPMQALSTTATKSFGTVSYSGLLCAIVEQFYKWTKLRWYHLIPPYLFIVGPLKIALCILGWCLKSCLQMLTKFSLVLHVFTGDTFFGSAKKCFGIMKRHFVGGFITEASSKNIMTIFAYVMAVAFCFSTWAWVDDEFDMVTIPGSTDDLWWILWTMLAAFCIYYPVLGLFFLVVLNGWMAEWSTGSGEKKLWVPAFCATFVGCIVKLFFDYMGGIILDSIDVMFLCFAIDKDNNVDLSKSAFAAICVDIPGVITTANPLQEPKDPLLVAAPVQPGQFVAAAGTGVPQGQVQPFGMSQSGGVQMMPLGQPMMPLGQPMMPAMGLPVAMGQPMEMANMTPEQMQQQQMMFMQQQQMMQQQMMMQQQPQQATM